MSDRPLTGLQAAFVRAYARLGVAETAALEAGYSKTTARNMAQRMLRHPGIRAELDALTQSTRDETIADAKERKRFWTKLMRDESQEPQHRMKASELLGKTDGDFIDKVEHSGEVRGAPTIIITGYDDEDPAD